MVKPEDVTPSDEQVRAWGFYGIPRNAQRAIGSKAPAQAVGEVRYVVGWMADQMVRMGWRITVDGNESWSIALPDGAGTIRSDADAEDMDEPTHPVNASAALLETVGWTDATVRQVTTNLFVGGELYYLNEGGTWSVVSVIDQKLKERLRASAIEIRGLWPHPADPDSPDAPLFAVLGVLDDMLWLTRLSRAQSANRVAMRGIIAVSDQMTMAKGGTSEQFWNDFEQSLSRGMDNPEDVSPVMLRGPKSEIEPKAGGMSGLAWLIPQFPYDDKIDARMEKLIQRLAYGLPVPPEILLGMQAQSRATAFQVEANSYRAHVEPAAWTVAQVPEDALKALLPDIGKIRVLPDPAAILARKASVQDAFDAFDRGAITLAYLRDILGIPESAAPDTEELALIMTLLGKKVTVDGTTTDPANEAAEEGITAAATLPREIEQGTPPAGGESRDDEWVSTKLAAIDEQLLFELSGAAEQAVVKARERIGANLRSSAGLRNQIPADLSNEQVALKVGADAAAAVGIDTKQVIRGALAATVRWWRTRLSRAQSDIVEVLATGDVDLEFSRNSATMSEQTLEAVLTAAVFEPNALHADALRDVLTVAGG